MNTLRIVTHRNATTEHCFMVMTKADALARQARQVDHYAAIYGERVRQIVADATRADELPDGEHEVVVINRYIPRGGAIEMLLGIFQQPGE